MFQKFYIKFVPSESQTKTTDIDVKFFEERNTVFCLNNALGPQRYYNKRWNPAKMSICKHL